MAQVWGDDEHARGFKGGRGASKGGETLVYHATGDHTACRRPSGVRLPGRAGGGRRPPPAPQAIGRLLVLLASLGVVLLTCAVLWVGLGLVVTILLRLLGP